MIGNDRQVSNTPWNYYHYIFRLPLLNNQTTVNYERFTDKTAWNLTQLLDKTPATNQSAMKKTTVEAAEIQFMQDLPAIPLWYNGALGAVEHVAVWTNLPSSTGKGKQTMPVFWRNYFQMTGIETLTNLKPSREQVARAERRPPLSPGGAAAGPPIGTTP